MNGWRSFHICAFRVDMNYHILLIPKADKRLLLKIMFGNTDNRTLNTWF